MISKFVLDTKIGSVVGSEEKYLMLQKDINGIIGCADQWQTESKPDKYQVMHFRKKKQTGEYSMNGSTLGSSKGASPHIPECDWTG